MNEQQKGELAWIRAHWGWELSPSQVLVLLRGIDEACAEREVLTAELTQLRGERDAERMTRESLERRVQELESYSAAMARGHDESTSELTQLRARAEELTGALAGIWRFAQVDVRRGPAISGWTEAISAADRAISAHQPAAAEKPTEWIWG